MQTKTQDTLAATKLIDLDGPASSEAKANAIARGLTRVINTILEHSEGIPFTDVKISWTPQHDGSSTGRFDVYVEREIPADAVVCPDCGGLHDEEKGDEEPSEDFLAFLEKCGFQLAQKKELVAKRK